MEPEEINFQIHKIGRKRNLTQEILPAFSQFL